MIEYGSSGWLNRALFAAACIGLASGALACERKSSAYEAPSKDDHGHRGAGKLPDGWPSSVPVYPGAQVTSSAATHSLLVTLETSDGAEAVAAFYRTNTPGWTKQSDAALGASHMMKLNDGHRLLSIIANKAGDKTHVTMSIEPK